MNKSQHLQLRVTPAQKAALKHHARRAGMDMSSYLLARALPPAKSKFQGLVDQLIEAGDQFDDRRFVLAALSDWLAQWSASELRDAVAEVDLGDLPPFSRNYLAAMVEHASARINLDPPAWTREVTPLEQPWFAVPFASLRPHLIKNAPVAFKRRNLFVDSAVGDRV